MASSRRRAAGRRSLKLAILAGAGTALLASVGWAATPTIAFDASTPEAGTTLTGAHTVHVRVSAQQPRNSGEVPSFVRAVDIRVLVVDGKRGAAYEGGDPIYSRRYRCPGEEATAEDMTSTVDAEAPWDTNGSVNGVYRIAVSATSCRAEDAPATAERSPLKVANPPPPAYHVEAAATSDAVRVFWLWNGVDDGDGFRVERAPADDNSWRAAGTSQTLTFDDHPPPGSWRYRVVALRRPPDGDRDLVAPPSEPSEPVDAQTVTAPTSSGTGGANALDLPAVDTSPVNSPPLSALSLPDEGTYEATLPATDSPAVAGVDQGPQEWGAGDPTARDSVQSLKARRRRSAGEVLDARLGMLGGGLVLLVAAAHVAAYVRRTRPA